VSGAGRTRRRWPRLRARIEASGLRVHTHLTTAPGEATDLTRGLLQAGVREILSVGGDGTANEVVNGFFLDGAPVAVDAVLTVLPTGTGHDFARSLGIRSVDHALAVLRDGTVRRIDLGLLEFQAADGTRTRYFVNAADAGLGATAAALINRSRKVLGGLLTYLLGALRAALRYEGQPVEVVVDGRRLVVGPAEMVLVANGRFHAGGMRLAPRARLTDGAFEIFVLERVSRLALITSVLPRAYFGRHAGHPGVRYVRGREVRIRAAKPLPVELDGEQPGTTDARAWVVPGALWIRMPVDAQSGTPGRGRT